MKTTNLDWQRWQQPARPRPDSLLLTATSGRSPCPCCSPAGLRGPILGDANEMKHRKHSEQGRALRKLSINVSCCLSSPPHPPLPHLDPPVPPLLGLADQGGNIRNHRPQQGKSNLSPCQQSSEHQPLCPHPFPRQLEASHRASH